MRRDFGPIRDCLIAIPASEAVCESIFSFSKRIINPIANWTNIDVKNKLISII